MNSKQGVEISGLFLIKAEKGRRMASCVLTRDFDDFLEMV